MSARRRVTSTLGRNGQVFKRAPLLDVSRHDHKPTSGSKRPITERLGNNVDDPNFNANKRRGQCQRKKEQNWSSSDDDMEEGKQYMSTHRVSRDDLRFKLIHKSLSKSSSTADEQNHVDLREKLSRNSHISSKYEARRAVAELRPTGFIRRIPSTRSAGDLLQLDSPRKAYSYSVDRLRCKSPDRLLGASRVMSPPRNFEDMQHDLRHVSSIRSVDTSRPTNFMIKNIDISRPEPIMRKAMIPADALKPLLQAPPPGGSVQKISYMSEESVPNLLHALGLGKYAIIFQAEEVDMTALKQLGDNDLKELGIPMGPRKKILLAVFPRRKHQLS